MKIITVCPKCGTKLEGDACQICERLERVRLLARDNRRQYAVKKQTERQHRLPYKDL
jgi:hypothetical protein